MSADVLGLVAGLPWPALVGGAALGGTLVFWVVVVRPREPRPTLRWATEAPPDRDAVSLAMRAVNEDRYRPLLGSAHRQLNRWAVEATGFPIDRLPSRSLRFWRRERPAMAELRRLRARLRRLSRRALWLETAWLPRPDPWRTRRGSFQLLRRQVADLLGDLDRRLAGGPPQT